MTTASAAVAPPPPRSGSHVLQELRSTWTRKAFASLLLVILAVMVAQVVLTWAFAPAVEPLALRPRSFWGLWIWRLVPLNSLLYSPAAKLTTASSVFSVPWLLGCLRSALAVAFALLVPVYAAVAVTALRKNGAVHDYFGRGLSAGQLLAIRGTAVLLPLLLVQLAGVTASFVGYLIMPVPAAATMAQPPLWLLGMSAAATPLLFAATAVCVAALVRRTWGAIPLCLVVHWLMYQAMPVLTMEVLARVFGLSPFQMFGWQYYAALLAAQMAVFVMSYLLAVKVLERDRKRLRLRVGEG